MGRHVWLVPIDAEGKSADGKCSLMENAIECRQTHQTNETPGKTCQVIVSDAVPQQQCRWRKRGLGMQLNRRCKAHTYAGMIQGGG